MCCIDSRNDCVAALASGEYKHGQEMRSTSGFWRKEVDGDTTFRMYSSRETLKVSRRVMNLQPPKSGHNSFEPEVHQSEQLKVALQPKV